MWKLPKESAVDCIAQQWQVLKSAEKTSWREVELFAGAGGLALRMENAGFNCELLAEIGRDACETLRRNRPDWDVRCTHMAAVDFSSVQADVALSGIQLCGQASGF